MLGTGNEELMREPNIDKGLEVFADTDFADGFNSPNAEDPRSAHSRTRLITKHARCPIIWKSKLQTEIALPTIEA